MAKRLNRCPLSRGRLLKFFMLLLLGIYLSSEQAGAREITLGWTPNQELDLAGYRLFCESKMMGDSGYDNRTLVWQGCIQGKGYCPDLGAPTVETNNDMPTATIQVDDREHYRIFARAFDVFGNESTDSKPVYWPFLTGLSIQGPARADENSSVIFTVKSAYDNGTSQTVAAVWSDNSPYATINNNGVLITSSVSENKTVLVTAVYTEGGVRKTAKKLIAIRKNVPPDRPLLSTPYFGEPDVSLSPVLSTAGFADGDGDGHVATIWEVSKSATDFSETSLVFVSDTDVHLVSITIPDDVLDDGATYFWRVRFQDIFSMSPWSEVGEFTTEFDGEDTDRKNGIPDDQEVSPMTDLDRDGVSDVSQPDIKCVNTMTGNMQVGVKAGLNVVAVEKLKAIEPEHYQYIDGAPDELYFGLFGFRVQVAKAGDVGEITLYFSEPMPEGAMWYKYDSVNGWLPGEFVSFWALSSDRLSVTLHIEDGGPGDADGVRNGVIVDPGGMGIDYPMVSASGDTISDVVGSSGSSGNGGGAGGCFLSETSVSGAGKVLHIRAMVAVLSRLSVLTGLLFAAVWLRRPRGD